ncbi:TPA_asm: protein 5 [Ranunculus virus 1]|uniref:Protein 5 n=1 Tax=Ranunculus virus 1 TaxID=2977983 RepID=A0A9N7AAT7_9RHAB|nr:TPA_asm: protein 5 [Ranunculus virus 1]
MGLIKLVYEQIEMAMLTLSNIRLLMSRLSHSDDVFTMHQLMMDLKLLEFAFGLSSSPVIGNSAVDLIISYILTTERKINNIISICFRAILLDNSLEDLKKFQNKIISFLVRAQDAFSGSELIKSQLHRDNEWAIKTGRWSRYFSNYQHQLFKSESFYMVSRTPPVIPDWDIENLKVQEIAQLIGKKSDGLHFFDITMFRLNHDDDYPTSAASMALLVDHLYDAFFIDKAPNFQLAIDRAFLRVFPSMNFAKDDVLTMMIKIDKFIKIFLPAIPPSIWSGCWKICDDPTSIFDPSFVVFKAYASKEDWKSFEEDVSRLEVLMKLGSFIQSD